MPQVPVFQRALPGGVSGLTRASGDLEAWRPGTGGLKPDFGVSRSPGEIDQLFQ
jgi:hypothetical protein